MTQAFRRLNHRAGAPLVALLLCVACGQSSTLPTTPSAAFSSTPQPDVPDFAGTWTGTWMAATCTGSPAPDDYYAAWCDGFFSSRVVQISLYFDLKQNGNIVSGLIRRATNDLPPPQVVTASIDGSGTVVLTERLSVVRDQVDGIRESQDTTWTLRKADDGTLAGSVTIRRELTGDPTSHGQIWGQVDGTIKQASRSAS